LYIFPVIISKVNTYYLYSNSLLLFFSCYSILFDALLIYPWHYSFLHSLSAAVVIYETGTRVLDIRSREIPNQSINSSLSPHLIFSIFSMTDRFPELGNRSILAPKIIMTLRSNQPQTALNLTVLSKGILVPFIRPSAIDLKTQKSHGKKK